MTTSAHCHKLIAQVAHEAAAELYEVVMANNQVRAEWKRQHPGLSDKGLLNAFVARNWGKCIPLARTTLGLMLRQPSISEAQKEEIVEALALDATLMRGRQNPSQIIGTLQ